MAILESTPRSEMFTSSEAADACMLLFSVGNFQAQPGFLLQHFITPHHLSCVL